MTENSKIVLALFWLCALSLSAPCARSQGETSETTEQQLERTSPWIVYLDVAVKREFLNYRGSTMPSLTLVYVDYRKKNENLDWGQTTKYEDLWYREGKAVGLRRYCPLSLQQDGVIYVKSSALVRENTDAIANAVVRLLLDILAAKQVVRTTFVPKDIFGQVLSEFEKVGFQNFTTVQSGDQAIVLHLTSYPPGVDRYVRYKGVSSN